MLGGKPQENDPGTANSELGATEPSLSVIAEAVPDALINIDGHGQIIFLNTAAAQMFGYAKSDLLGANITTLIPERYRFAHKRGLSRFITTGQGHLIGHTIELSALGKEGDEFPIELSLAAWHVASQPFITGIIRNISERKKNEEVLIENEIRYRALFERSPDPVLLIDPRTATPIEFNEAAHRQLGYTREEFEKLRISDIEAMVAPERILDRIKYISQHGSDVFETKHRTKDGEIIDVLVSASTIRLAGHTLLLEIFHDITMNKEAKMLSDALGKINRNVSRALDFDQIMQSIVEEASKAIGCESAGILMHDGNSWVPKYLSGELYDGLVGQRLPAKAAAPVELAAKTKELVVVNDAVRDDRVDREWMKRLRIRSFLTAPLITNEGVVGVLALHYHSAPVAFTAAQIDFSEKLAASVSLAVQTARSHEVTRQALSDIHALHRVSARITQTLELDDVLETALVEALGAVEVEHGCIYLLDQSRHLAIRIQKQLSEEFLKAKTTISLGEGCAGNAAITKEGYFPSEGQDGFVCEDSKKLLGLDCLVAMPIVTKGTVLGVLELFAPVRRRLSSREREIIKAMADQLAPAIENAQLYATEKRIADILQETLLTVPERMEGIDFGQLYRSASVEAGKTGGDFYDLFELGHDEVGILIGDVSGKGLQAAALTSMVKNTIKAYAYQKSSPAEVVAMTNNVVLETCRPQSFVTLFFAVFEKNSGRVVYCNAGHPPPIVKRRVGEVTSLLANNPAIGMFPELDYIDNQEHLEVGDTLVLFTDGIIEARREKELYGEGRLTTFINDLRTSQAQEIPHLLFREVEAFSNHTLLDDIAILAISPERTGA